MRKRRYENIAKQIKRKELIRALPQLYEVKNMATGREYLEFIMEQLSEIEGITFRQMMGEYIIYYDGKIAAYLCDNRLLVKPVPSAAAMLPDAVYEAPYEGAKEMILVEQVDDKGLLTGLFRAMYDELPVPKKKRGSKK